MDMVGFSEDVLKLLIVDVEESPTHENLDRKSTRLNSSHDQISYAVFCLKKKNIENELVELLTHRLLVEHAKHCVLAVYRRHDGDAEVDGTLGLYVSHPKTSVLRNPPFRNVQLTHHLDAGDDGGVMLLADRRHGLR